jgi:hypothetical protein
MPCSGRSPSGGDASRSLVRAPSGRARRSSSGARYSMPWAAHNSFHAEDDGEVRRSSSVRRRAAWAAMLTWSSWLAEVGVESVEHGMGEVLVLAHQRGGGDFGDHVAGVEAGLGRQERRQVEGQRWGRPSARCAAGRWRRSRRCASAIWSAAKATGSAWKLPPETMSPVPVSTSGLSVTPLASDLQRGGLPEAHQVYGGPGHLRLAADAIRDPARGWSPSRWLSRISDALHQRPPGGATSIWPR